MNLITDFFICDKNEIVNLDVNSPVLEKYHGMEIKSIDSVKLAALQEILCDTDFEENLVSQEAFGPEEGPWIISVPDELINALAVLESDEIETVIKKWHSSEEFRNNEWDKNSLNEVVNGMKELSVEAVNENKKAYVRVSL